MHSNINHGRLTSEQSCTRTLEHSNTKWYWVNHGRTIMHSNTRQAKSRQARALKRQASRSCLLRVDAFGRRAVEVIICMITRDFSVISIDVTGVSLSLSHRRLSLSLSLLLTKVTHAQYRKRFRVSYNTKITCVRNILDLQYLTFWLFWFCVCGHCLLSPSPHGHLASARSG